jgi:hypothetical protein
VHNFNKRLASQNAQEKTMTLKAVKPQVIEPGKPKFMISGRSGVGKTIFSLQFEAPYYFDIEGGAVRSQYRKLLENSGGAYFGREQGAGDFASVIEEVKALATTKHVYKTIILDSFSHLYNSEAAKAEEKMGSDFGKDKKEANRPSRQLIRWLEDIDMTVVLVCHSRQKWERRGKDIIDAGTTFDGFDKLEFTLDLWIEAQKMGQTRTFTVKKSRIDAFPEGKEFTLDFKVFADLYGKESLARNVVPIELATPEQVRELSHLIDVVKIDEATREKWLERGKATTWAELKKDQAQGCIDFLKKKLSPVSSPVSEVK